jgi:hypothetical protein
MNAQKEDTPSPYQTHEDGDGKHHFSSSPGDVSRIKRLKLTTTDGIGLYNDTTQPNTMESNTIEHGTIAEPLHPGDNGASSITISGPLDNAAKETSTAQGDKLSNIANLEDNPDGKNLDNTWYVRSKYYVTLLTYMK